LEIEMQNRMTVGIAGSQLGSKNLDQAIDQLQKSSQMVQGHAGGILDLIAGAHDALSALQQSVGALEQRIGGVLRAPYPEEQSAAGTAGSDDAHAVEQLRYLLTRISQATATVNSLNDRVQV
jgi:uncharacterized protein YukE